MISIAGTKTRKFLPESFDISSWDILRPYYESLVQRKLDSPAALQAWLMDLSELSAVVSEDLAWRYIKNSCDTTNQQAKEAYEFFVVSIQPQIAPYDDALNRKLLQCPHLDAFLSELPADKKRAYEIYLRQIRKQVEIYREENIPLFTKLQTEEQRYAEIAGAMTVEMQGQEITLQQAANYLRDTRRETRMEAYEKIGKRRLIDEKELDDLFSSLVKTRHQVALNAGFANYRDYMFAALGRFDYSVQDCMNFHESIAREIVPICNQIDRDRKEKLGLDKLKPWDTEVDLEGKAPIQPFNGGDDLIEKTIACFTRIHPFLGECMNVMRSMQHLDLDSRKGKAPGGYNYPLYETGVPFIFMNSVNSLRDLITMVHEGGHAVHSFLTRELDFVSFKDTPSEVSELASMSMELISMEHWDVFMPNAEELRRAKRHQLEKVIGQLPWIAVIDKFQHWIYTHPDHTASERKEAWTAIFKEFAGNVIDWEGQDALFSSAWQRQLHLFQVPFYYIEYGMAQLGAIAVWRNYKHDPGKALENYMNALKLGYTHGITGIYETAGIRFDFSSSYIRELAGFVQDELKKVSQ